MPALTIRWSDRSGLDRFTEGLERLNEGKLRKAFAQSLNKVGGKGRTQVRQRLTAQTGLPRKTIVAAVKEHNASEGSLRHVLSSSGGDVALKYFSPREQRAGVKAKPFGQWTLFPTTFMRGGRFPNRVETGRFDGHVVDRVGADKWPVTRVKSGVVIPEQMLKDPTAGAWRGVVERDLPDRVLYDMRRVAGAIFG